MAAEAISCMRIEQKVHQLEEVMIANLVKFNTASEEEEPCTIYRVLPFVREGHEIDYEPRIISIGPFHEQKMKATSIQQLKWTYLHDLLIRSGNWNILSDYIRKVAELEKTIRKKYGEEIKLDNNSFVEMMVVDACFLLELLIKTYTEDEKLKQLLAVNWKLPLIRNDTLLFENQIPFFVLQSLFELSYLSDLPDIEFPNNSPVSFMKLAVYFVNKDKIHSQLIHKDPGDVHHLLHLLHLSLDPTSNRVNGGSWGDRAKHIIRHKLEMVLVYFLWLWFKLWMLITGQFCKFHEPPMDVERSRAPRMFPNASELRDSGVKFVKKCKPKNLFDLDISFTDGVMEIPMLAIQDGTSSQLRNLIAFEQCSQQSGSHITSYVTLLNNLIDTEEDVAILKKSGIFESKLGKDKELADLFNKLCTGAYLNFEKHYLAKLFKEVTQYSEVSYHRWRASLMRNYFGNPWSIISLIAAIVLLLLTIVQTIYTVNAYYNPPS